MPPKKPAAKKAEAEPVAAPPAAIEPAGDVEQQIVVPGANDWDAPRIYIKPKEQLQLTEKELSEEITKILRANNPEAPNNIVRFFQKERAFKIEPGVDQNKLHYLQEGQLMHKDTEEAKHQKEK